jgi:hypothetical protein
MLDDVVIDTNVLMHACDPRQAHQGQCLRLIELMRDGNALLLVDEGTNPQKPLEGFVMSEYTARLAPGTPGQELLILLLSSSRVSGVPRHVPRPVAKELERIPNTRDRKFVAVAWNSVDHVLASQDFTDFPRKVRRRIQDKISVEILDATDCGDRL